MTPDQLRLLDALGRLELMVPDRKRWNDRGLAFRIFDYYGLRQISEAPFENVSEIVRREGERRAAAGELGFCQEQWDSMRRELAHAERRRGPNRPRTPKEIRTLAEHLVDYWEAATGKKFTSDWERNEQRGELGPTTKGTKFLHDVFSLIDPDVLRLLPVVSRKIVADRKRATCKK